MANGFVIDEVGGCGKCFLSFIWIVLTIFAVTLAITEILQLGFITKSIQQDIQSKDGSLLGLVHSSVDNEKFDALLSSSDAITFQELIQNGKMEDIEENIKEYKRNLLTQTYTINDEESDSSDSSNTPETYIFYDVEPNLKIYNQFQATSCQPYVVIDKSKKSVDDLTMSGNATFYWFNESSENTKDNFNQPVSFHTQYHSRSQALNKQIGWGVWVLRSAGLVSYFVLFMLNFFMNIIPSNSSPFAVTTNTMSYGLMFSALSVFVLFLMYGWALIYLIFSYSEIRTPLYEKRFFVFFITTCTVILLLILHLLFALDLDQLTPISMLCSQLICNGYSFILTICFFPKDIKNADEYGITDYTLLN
ncbi:Wntless-like transmembrane domain-containing protein [Entamoeba marina]